MTDSINTHFKSEDYSFFETNTSNLFNSELFLTDFIGFPFNFKKNPELEDIKSKNNEYNINDLYNYNNDTDFKACSHSKKFDIHKFSVCFQKKRGRIKTDINNNKSHDKYKSDNIIRKVQVSYINFLTQFVNEILIKIGRKDLLFIPLDYFYKRIVNKEHRDKLKHATIEEVLKSKISRKYSTKNKDTNAYKCEIIKKENIKLLIDILNKEFLFFFDKIYLKNYRKFNLKEFGLDDLEIELSDSIMLYQDLLLKNKKDINYPEYKAKINICIKQNFLPQRKEIFKCNY